MPVFNAEERIKKGEIRPEDVPYMQRGGRWDNTDIKGAKNVRKWLPSDKAYADGGYKKEQSVSIFGGANLPWNIKPVTGPSQPPNVNDMKGAAEAGAAKKGWFGF